MKKKMAVLMCVLLVSSMVLTTAAVSAKKPDKPPGGGGGGYTPTGTLYIMDHDDGVNWVWTMDPDGTNAAKDHYWAGTYHQMSRSQHGDEWWYVGFKQLTGTYPDGQPRYEIFATCGDGQTQVQLTDDLDMEMNYLSIEPEWGLEDDTITWSALVWDVDANGDDYVKEAGLYQASVTWDSNGDVTGIGTISQLLETGWANYGTSEKCFVNARDSLDWSPDGKKAIYRLYDKDLGSGYINIHDFDTGTDTMLVAGYYPKWSPDGTLIAFGENNHLYLIKPDGTGRTTLAESATKGAPGRIRDWHWEPESKFLSYRYYAVNYNKYPTTAKNYVYVVDIDGNKDCVTNGMDTAYKGNIAWR